MDASHYRQYQPMPALAPFIECYWVLRSPASAAPTPERLIPGGRIECMFNLGDPCHWLLDSSLTSPTTPASRRIQIMGQRDRIYYTRATGYIDMVGIRFKPGGISAFTRIPVSDLLNRMTPADQLFGAITGQWEDRMAAAPGDKERVLLLDTLLQNALRQEPPAWQPLQFALETIKTTKEDLSINTLCEQQLGWNYRRLERAFLQSVGYTPKHYSRLVRFNQAIRLMNKSRDSSLTSIGYDAGYFDQSHFIRDFRRYTGTTPGRFGSESNAIADILIRWQPV